MTDVHHHIVLRHEVGIEVWPPRAEVSFQDDWIANPINSQARFEAQVYNSDQGFTWEVRDIAGGAGQGTIDASGLYQAPPKGSLASGVTELVVATAREDPLRKAFAWVTLVGVGPRPARPAEVDIWPPRINLYYKEGAANRFIDICNKACVFTATAYNTSDQVEWFVDGTSQGVGPSFLYQTPDTGGDVEVTVVARLQADPAVFDEAKILQINYDWPGV